MESWVKGGGILGLLEDFIWRLKADEILREKPCEQIKQPRNGKGLLEGKRGSTQQLLVLFLSF